MDGLDMDGLDMNSQDMDSQDMDKGHHNSLEYYKIPRQGDVQFYNNNEDEWLVDLLVYYKEPSYYDFLRNIIDGNRALNDI